MLPRLKLAIAIVEDILNENAVSPFAIAATVDYLPQRLGEVWVIDVFVPPRCVPRVWKSIGGNKGAYTYGYVVISKSPVRVKPLTKGTTNESPT